MLETLYAAHDVTLLTAGVALFVVAWRADADTGAAREAVVTTRAVREAVAAKQPDRLANTQL